jgi:hypothetical protein
MFILIDESNEDVIIPEKIDVNIIKKFVKVMKKLKDNIDKYMPIAKIDNDKKKLTHNKYLNIQNQRLKNLDAKLEKIKVAFIDDLFK